ncbi:UNVERIFIED_CONTAM: hypothetical protein NCL1_58402 [Trichonephila clavipes]
MSSMKALNRIMGNILVQLTKLSSKPLRNLTQLELRTVLDTLLEIKEEFENIKQAYFEIDNVDEFKDVELLLNKIEEYIQELQKANNVRLDEIPLPQFDGQFRNWSYFKSQFHNLIQKNPKFSDYQKLFYLNDSLNGAAKQVQSPKDSLFKALSLRYENNKLIVDSHIQSIINYKPLVKESSAKLRLLIDNLQKNISSLEALKFEHNNLVDILLIH